MFEALRGLRDAVAPESGNLGNSMNRNVVAAQQQPSSAGPRDDPPPPTTTTPEELWMLYQAGDESARQQLTDASAVPPSALVNQAAWIEWCTTVERKKDAALVETLAQAVLRQSAAIDTAVDQFTARCCYRTRTEQWQYLQELMQLNAQAAEKLEEAYAQALERRNQCRQFVLENTSRALGIEETK